MVPRQRHSVYGPRPRSGAGETYSVVRRHRDYSSDDYCLNESKVENPHYQEVMWRPIFSRTRSPGTADCPGAEAFLNHTERRPYLRPNPAPRVLLRVPKESSLRKTLTMTRSVKSPSPQKKACVENKTDLFRYGSRRGVGTARSIA